MADVASLRVRIDASAARAGAAAVGSALRDMGQRARGTFNTVRSATSQLKSELFSIRSAVGALAVGFGTRDILDAAGAMTRINNSLRTVTGSAEGAAQEFGFISDESERLGLNLEGTALSYSKLAAASKGTNLEGENTRNIFVAVSEAATVLGLSAEQTGGALTAIEQIISKGKVSAEELRGQLGERLPGAFQIAARAMGVTTSALDKMLSQGQLLSEDFLPKFAEEIRRTFGDEVANSVNGVSQRLNRFKNDLFLLKLDFAQSGFLEGFLGGLEELRETLKDPEFKAALREIGELAGQAFARAADAIGWAAENMEELAAAGGAYVGLRLGRAFGPIGAAVGAATGGVVAYNMALREANEESEELKSTVDEVASVQSGVKTKTTGALESRLEELKAQIADGLERQAYLYDRIVKGAAAIKEAERRLLENRELPGANLTQARGGLQNAIDEFEALGDELTAAMREADAASLEVRSRQEEAEAKARRPKPKPEPTDEQKARFKEREKAEERLAGLRREAEAAKAVAAAIAEGGSAAGKLAEREAEAVELMREFGSLAGASKGEILKILEAIDASEEALKKAKDLEEDRKRIQTERKELISGTTSELQSEIDMLELQLSLDNRDVDATSTQTDLLAIVLELRGQITDAKLVELGLSADLNDLTDEEVAKLKEQLDLRRQLRNELSVRDRARAANTPAFVQNDRDLATARDLIGKPGGITQAEYDALEASMVKSTKLAEDQKSKVKELSDEWRDLGHVIATGFEDALLSGKKLSEVLRSLAQDIAKIGLRAFVTGPLQQTLIGGGPGLFNTGDNGLLGDLRDSLGFATGGSFTVGGVGGQDSQVVAFKATPGETVDVSTPGQSSDRSSGPPVVHVHVAGGINDRGRLTPQQIGAMAAREITRYGRRNN